MLMVLRYNECSNIWAGYWNQENHVTTQVFHTCIEGYQKPQKLDKRGAGIAVHYRRVGQSILISTPAPSTRDIALMQKDVIIMGFLCMAWLSCLHAAMTTITVLTILGSIYGDGAKLSIVPIAVHLKHSKCLRCIYTILGTSDFGACILCFAVKMLDRLSYS